MDWQKDNPIKDKIKRLCSAVYLVTGFLSDEEPIKWKLRALSLSLMSHDESLESEVVLKLVDQILSLIEAPLSVKAVSEMNFTLLKKEYLSLRDLVTKQQKTLILTPEPSRPQQTSIPPNQGSIKSGVAKTSNNSRQAQILHFIKQKGWSSIKDIAHAVPNFSSKTVQRELVELVRAGVLKKEGDRRWSRYLVLS